MSDLQDWLSKAVAVNAERRRVRYAEHKATRARWMVECRDLWDAHDADAGVYFKACSTDEDLEGYVISLNPSDSAVLGIYDLQLPLDPQGPGLKFDQWQARRGSE